MHDLDYTPRSRFPVNICSRSFGRLDIWTFGRFARTLALLAIGICADAAHAQSRVPHAPPQQKPIVVHSTTVHTVSGRTIENGYILFENGVITALGEGSAPLLANAEEINAGGMHVYPGLIGLDTQLGLSETASVSVTIDHTELGRLTPEVRAAVAVNPDSDLIPVTRSNGILTSLIMPRGGLVSGRASIMRLDGWTWEQMAIDPEAGLVVNWPRTEPITAWWMQRSEEEQRREIAEDLESVERVFDEALAYMNAKAHDETRKTDLRYEAMRAAIEGEQPVYIRASSRGQIESAVAWAVRRDMKPVIVGGYEADQVIPLLKKHDVPVIVNGTHRLPSNRHEPYDAPFTLPAKLHEAGVRFAIASGAETAHERHLNHNAATAAAYGLPKDESLKAVTLHAADLIGLGESHGSLEAGKAATLMITTGDPLEITSDVLVAFIDGRRIDLGDRQKALYRKYQEKYRQLGLLEE